MTKLRVQEHNWANLWQQPNGFDNIMYDIMPYFVEQLELKTNLNPNDRILDIGCGPGYLEQFLQNKVKAMHGVDISDKYINHCESKFNNNCTFTSLNPDNYLDFQSIKQHKYTKVIILSVIQYYKSIDEVKTLIFNLIPLVEKGGEIIIADIVVKTGKFRDTWDLFKYVLKKGHMIHFIQFALYALFSDYGKLRKTLHLLIINQEMLADMASKLKLNYEFIDNLTIHSARKNMVIHL